MSLSYEIEVLIPASAMHPFVSFRSERFHGWIINELFIERVKMISRGTTKTAFFKRVSPVSPGEISIDKPKQNRRKTKKNVFSFKHGSAWFFKTIASYRFFRRFFDFHGQFLETWQESWRFFPKFFDLLLTFIHNARSGLSLKQFLKHPAECYREI